MTKNLGERVEQYMQDNFPRCEVSKITISEGGRLAIEDTDLIIKIEESVIAEVVLEFSDYDFYYSHCHRSKKTAKEIFEQSTDAPLELRTITLRNGLKFVPSTRYDRKSRGNSNLENVLLEVSRAVYSDNLAEAKEVLSQPIDIGSATLTIGRRGVNVLETMPEPKSESEDRDSFNSLLGDTEIDL